jgi:hypothetical protein
MILGIAAGIAAAIDAFAAGVFVGRSLKADKVIECTAKAVENAKAEVKEVIAPKGMSFSELRSKMQGHPALVGAARPTLKVE